MADYPKGVWWSGGHTFDLMVLDSNVMKDRVTVCLALPEVRPQGPLG